MKKKLTTLLLAGSLVIGNTIPAFAGEWHSGMDAYQGEGQTSQACRECGAHEIGIKRSESLGSTYGFSWVSFWGHTVQSEVNVGGKKATSIVSSSGWAQTATIKKGGDLEVKQQHVLR